MCKFVIYPLTGFYRSPDDFNGEFVSDLDDQFDGKLDGVQWEYHLSRANASKMIHDQLLAIHYIIVIEEYDSRAKTKALECLPTPLMRGGLAWFRVSFCELPNYLLINALDLLKEHYQNEAFEGWCEQVIAMRAKIYPSALGHFSNVPTQSGASEDSQVSSLTKRGRKRRGISREAKAAKRAKG